MKSILWEYKYCQCSNITIHTTPTQVDDEFWDSYALRLVIIETDPHSGSEVIHCVMKYPVSQKPTYNLH